MPSSLLECPLLYLSHRQGVIYTQEFFPKMTCIVSINQLSKGEICNLQPGHKRINKSAFLDERVDIGVVKTCAT